MKAIWRFAHYEHRIRDAADYEAQRRYLRNNPAPGNPNVADTLNPLVKPPNPPQIP